MLVVIGSDHAGRLLKGAVAEHLEQGGHQIQDVGTFSEYPGGLSADLCRCGPAGGTG